MTYGKHERRADLSIRRCQLGPSADRGADAIGIRIDRGRRITLPNGIDAAGSNWDFLPMHVAMLIFSGLP